MGILNIQFAEIKKELHEIRETNEPLRTELKGLKEEVTELRKENVDLRKTNKDLCDKLRDCEMKIDDLECRSKPNILVIYGLPRHDKQTDADCKGVLKDLLTDKLELTDNVEFDRVLYILYSFVMYLAICHNPQWRITHQMSRILITTIWLLGACLPVPWAIFYEHFSVPGDFYICHQIWPNFFSQRAYFVGAIFVGTYLFPLLIVLVCYIFIGFRVWNRRAPGVPKDNRLIRRSKMKVVKMLAVMVLLFAMSWLPLHAIYFKFYYDPPYSPAQLDLLSNIAIPIAQWLELSNSGINPVVYCFFSKNFRNGFRNMCFFRGRQRRFSGAYSSTTKYMTIEYYNGNVTIIFRRDNRDDSSSTI